MEKDSPSASSGQAGRWQLAAKYIKLGVRRQRTEEVQRERREVVAVGRMVSASAEFIRL